MIESRWTAPGQDPELALRVRLAAAQTAPELEPLLHQDRQDKNAWHMVFLEDGKPIAAGRINYVSPGVAELGKLCLLPDYRGQGIGDGLLKAMLLKAEGLGMKQAVVHCPRNTTGFFQTVEFRAEHADPETDLITMRRELGIGFKCRCAHQ